VWGSRGSGAGVRGPGAGGRGPGVHLLQQVVGPRHPGVFAPRALLRSVGGGDAISGFPDGNFQSLALRVSGLVFYGKDSGFGFRVRGLGSRV
jgi:hypothetical protein